MDVAGAAVGAAVGTGVGVTSAVSFDDFPQPAIPSAVTAVSTAKFVYLTNSTKGEIREIYLRAAGGEEWGKSLVPAEATIKDAEQVQMYYTPDSARDAIYDMKLVDGDGNAYEIYSVQLSDMEEVSVIPEELSVRSEASVLSAESLLSASLLSVSTLPIVLFSLLSLRLV